MMSIQAMTKQIAEYFKTQPVLKAWLFGSFARGEETSSSDVDILVRFDRTTSPIGLLAYMRMHRELEERLGRKVDLVEEGTLRPAAQQTANRDIKVIYERSN
jgi:predicted nucleotidyltransferase